jgi:formylglycine-generating enzyme required for sulfatase activity
MVMVYVPGAEFPQHEVTLSSFWIDRTEVTNTMYENCVADGACQASSYADDSNFNEADYPVVGVSWNDADTYCAWVGGQLPTEAQWEYAARGDDGRLYPWGNELPTCDLAQFSGCGSLTVPVGSFSPAGDSWVGAADMAGNVWEWVADWYDSDYYEISPADNPTGPASGDYKVLRGGSWNRNPIYLRVATRVNADPDLRPGNFGFRCAVPPGN